MAAIGERVVRSAHRVGKQVDPDTSGDGYGRGLDRRGEPSPTLDPPPVANQRLAYHVLGADGFEVEIPVVGIRVRERRPGLPDDEARVLSVGMTKEERGVVT